MYFNVKPCMLLHDQVTQIFFNLIFQYKCGRNFTGSMQAWANFLSIDIHFRLHRCRVICIRPNLVIGSTACFALSGRMNSSIASSKLLLVLQQFHIDEVNDDNSADIP